MVYGMTKKDGMTEKKKPGAFASGVFGSVEPYFNFLEM